MADPVCPRLSDLAAAAARAAGATVHTPATYLSIEGPQFSTRAESRMYQSWGAGVIGMRERARAQALLLDSCWRFIDPASVLAESDDGASLDGRLERVLEAALQRLMRRDFTG
jgi:5'-methylthioadenosine phosphorylase